MSRPFGALNSRYYAEALLKPTIQEQKKPQIYADSRGFFDLEDVATRALQRKSVVSLQLTNNDFEPSLSLGKCGRVMASAIQEWGMRWQ
jgi:hypothetical protein